jgi:exosortase
MEVNKIRVLIEFGSRDFGRCALASKLQTAFWPVDGRTAVERLIEYLAENRIKKVVICSNGLDKMSLADSIRHNDRLEVEYMDEPLPVGTAGCIRDAAAGQIDGLLMVFPAGLINPPSIDVLIEAHLNSGSDLTVMLNPDDSDSNQPGRASGIYVCSPRVIEYIPKGGYCDIKEGLIPEMLKAGKSVNAAVLPENAGNFRNRHEYLSAIADYLERKTPTKAQNCFIAPTARIIGPVAVMGGARISDYATIVGPAVISHNVTVGSGSIIINSVLWDGAQIGPDCRVQQSVVDYDAVLHAKTIINNSSVLCNKNNYKHITDTVGEIIRDNINRLMNMLPESVRMNTIKFWTVVTTSLVFVVFLWSYWPNIFGLWKIWLGTDEYSSGLLVPFLSVYILWTRRADFIHCPIKPALTGIVVLISAIALRLFGVLFVFSSAENLSIVLCIVGLVLLLFGWKMFRKTATILLFLCLMLPWPNRIQTAISLPLQEWSTNSAVFCLELCGFTVLQEGNVIHIGNATVAVAEACNGLRMITAFFVISGLVVLLVKRQWWEKLIVLASSLPIALLCNTVRLAITAMFFTILKGQYWEKLFHDFGGYAMMPLALLAVVAELRLITKLTTPPDQTKAIIITRGN